MQTLLMDCCLPTHNGEAMGGSTTRRRQKQLSEESLNRPSDRIATFPYWAIGRISTGKSTTNTHLAPRILCWPTFARLPKQRIILSGRMLLRRARMWWRRFKRTTVRDQGWCQTSSYWLATRTSLSLPPRNFWKDLMTGTSITMPGAFRGAWAVMPCWIMIWHRAS